MNTDEKEISLGHLKNDKESIQKLEFIINNFRSQIFQIFIENSNDVEFRWVEGDILIWVYVKWKFFRYITPEDWKELTDYYDNVKTVSAEIQPKSIDNDVLVVQVKRTDTEE